MGLGKTDPPDPSLADSSDPTDHFQKNNVRDNVTKIVKNCFLVNFSTLISIPKSVF